MTHSELEPIEPLKGRYVWITLYSKTCVSMALLYQLKYLTCSNLVFRSKLRSILRIHYTLGMITEMLMEKVVLTKIINYGYSKYLVYVFNVQTYLEHTGWGWPPFHWNELSCLSKCPALCHSLLLRASGSDQHTPGKGLLEPENLAPTPHWYCREEESKTGAQGIFTRLSLF